MIGRTIGKRWIRPWVPDGFVHWVRNRRVVVWIQTEMKWRRLRQADHNEVYGEDYFQMVDRTTGQSAGIMARSIVEQLRPKDVVDLGCGTGNLLFELRSLEVDTVGAEFADAALTYCRERGLDVREVDFTDEAALAEPLGKFDLAISTEVAIQLPPDVALNYVEYLCRHSDTVLFSSPPCAGDRRPRSPMTAKCWIAEFAKHGFELDAELSETLRTEWKEKGTASWFSRKPMVFRRSQAAAASG